MLKDYLGILFTIVIASGLSGVFLLLATILGPKKPSAEKDMPFESGEKPFESPVGRHAVKFYLAGMLFVLFDVEIIFLFPWAVIAKDLGAQSFWAMMIFLGLFLLGDAYAWRKGAFSFK